MQGTRLKKAKALAHKYMSEHDFESAWGHISEGLNVEWEDPVLLYMAGMFFREKGHSAIAAHLFRRGVALDPKAVALWLHYGACLHDMHRYEEAIDCFKMVQGLNPKDVTSIANIAAAYVQMGKFSDALNVANHALSKIPDYGNALVTKALACLGLGRWGEGFKLYKHMYGNQITQRIYRQPEEPTWNGQKGQTVVVQSDQGLGDEIMYSSILPDMAKDCKKVILDCHPKLVNLFKRSFPEIDVYGTKKLKSGVDWVEQYEIDAHDHVSGIGRFYRTRDKDFPRKPYLVASGVLREKWRDKLKDLPIPLVGITWQGGLVTTMRETRSGTPAQWGEVMAQGGSFIDLSYHDSSKEIEGTGIIRFDLDKDDYDDTVALIAELDCVVSVTTSVVHVCGAIGKKCFVVVPKWPAWRYGVRRDDMQWYPQNSVQLFRQEQDEEDFLPAIKRLSLEYSTYIHRL